MHSGVFSVLLKNTHIGKCYKFYRHISNLHYGSIRITLFHFYSMIHTLLTSLFCISSNKIDFSLENTRNAKSSVTIIMILFDLNTVNNSAV
jgi:hypothetical protein